MTAVTLFVYVAASHVGLGGLSPRLALTMKPFCFNRSIEVQYATFPLALVLFVAVAAGIFAWLQSQKAQTLATQETSARKEAETRRGEAERARLASIAQLLLIQAPQQQEALFDERGALMARQAHHFSIAGSQQLKIQVDSILRKVSGKPYFSSILFPKYMGAVAFSADGSKLASTYGDVGKVFLWDLTHPGEQPVTLSGWPGDLAPNSTPAGSIFALTFSPDGKTLLAANADGSVGRWDLEQLQAPFVALPRQKGGVWSAAYSPDGHWLALGTGSADNSIRIWDLTHYLNKASSQQVADAICDKVRRNMTLEEWYKFVGIGIPYERTCENLPIHPSLFETAEKLARTGEEKGAIALLERAVELDSGLELNPRQEVERWTKLNNQ